MHVALENVTLTYGDVDYLKNINVSFKAGLNILLGPTLAGKTSLMRVLAGLEKINQGRVYYEDKDVTGMPVQERNVAMVYQQFINYPGLTVYENIASPLRLQKKSKQEIEEKVQWAADILKLTPMLQRLPLELSGGQQQRCALARAIVKNSKLVLLDEPLANLDYKLREELRDELPLIFAKANAVLVYATSEPEEALKLGGNVAVMNEGEITQFGPTVDVYRAPKNIETARLFSDPPMNFVGVNVKDNQLSFRTSGSQQSYTLNDYTNLADGEYVAGFRPHHLLIKPGKDKNTDAMVKLEANVAISELTGSSSFIHLDANNPDGEDYRWVSLNQGIFHPELDSTLAVYLDLNHLYLYDTDGKRVAKTSQQVSEDTSAGHSSADDRKEERA